MYPPKCEECEKAGVKPDRIYCEGSSSTLLGYSPYYDGDGKLHDHDPNMVSTSYKCSNGHRWGVTSRRSCPTCGDWYGKGE